MKDANIGFWANLDQARKSALSGQDQAAETILRDLSAQLVSARGETAKKRLAVLVCFSKIHGLNFSKDADVSNAPSVLKARARLYIDVQHGLCNRLRAMASAAVMAAESERELVVIWQPDHHCDCALSDLFQYDGALLKHSFITEAKSGNMSVYNYMEAEPNAKKDTLINLDQSENIYVRSAYPLNSPATDWAGENAFLKSLTVSDRVLELKKTVRRNNILGVHVRMEGAKGLDHKSYDRPENWTPESHDRLHHWRATSHYSHFIKRIDALIKEGRAETLFLAADMPETYAIFAERYGERLAFLRREVFDRSTLQLQYALADVLLLSECGSLLGSSWSSFTELALRLTDNFEKVEMSGTDF